MPFGKHAGIGRCPRHGRHRHHGHHHRPARILVRIFDQPRRRVGVEVIDRLGIDDADLLALDEGRNRNHDGEFLRLALVVARHRNRGLISVAGQHHLRRFVEQLRVGLGDIEAAEGARRPGDELRQHRRYGDAHLQTGRGFANHRRAPCCAAAVQANRRARKYFVEQDCHRRQRDQREIERRPHLDVEREVVRERGDREREHEAAQRRIRAGARIGDHEKGEDQERAALQLMQRDRPADRRAKRRALRSNAAWLRKK